MDRRRFLESVGGLALTLVPTEQAEARERECEFPPISIVLGRPRIKAIGIGGAGGNILNQMIASCITGIDEYLYINTAAHALERSAADRKIILGTGEWQPAIAACRLAWNERDRITAAIADADVLLLIAGMGGVAGTVLAPVIAKLGRENGALTVALLVTPFAFEGRRPLRAARGVLVMQTIADWTKVRSNDDFIHPVPRTTTRLQACSAGIDAIIDDVRAVIVVVSGNYRRNATLLSDFPSGRHPLGAC